MLDECAACRKRSPWEVAPLKEPGWRNSYEEIVFYQGDVVGDVLHIVVRMLVEVLHSYNHSIFTAKPNEAQIYVRKLFLSGEDVHLRASVKEKM